MVHRVLCSRQHQDHEQHEPCRDYSDVPYLSPNANRCSELAGRYPLRKVEWYLDDQPHVSFATLLLYDCIAYHARVTDIFESQPMPANMTEATLRVAKPYFSFLSERPEEVTPYLQTIVISRGLRTALKTLESSYPQLLRNWDHEENLRYPQLQLYHCRELFSNATAKTLPPGQQDHLRFLSSYLNLRLSTEYQEAEEQFHAGIVHRRHWTKLYRPNDIVVTVVDGEELAYLNTNYPIVDGNVLTLQCWSWGFDGKFFRQLHEMRVSWTSDSTTMTLSDLRCYPLRYGRKGLSEERARCGEVFWSCRKRKYVEYQTAADLGSQAVRTPSLAISAGVTC